MTEWQSEYTRQYSPRDGVTSGVPRIFVSSDSFRQRGAEAKRERRHRVVGKSRSRDSSKKGPGKGSGSAGYRGGRQRRGAGAGDRAAGVSSAELRKRVKARRSPDRFDRSGYGDLIDSVAAEFGREEGETQAGAGQWLLSVPISELNVAEMERIEVERLRARGLAAMDAQQLAQAEFELLARRAEQRIASSGEQSFGSAQVSARSGSAAASSPRSGAFVQSLTDESVGAAEIANELASFLAYEQALEAFAAEQQERRQRPPTPIRAAPKVGANAKAALSNFVSQRRNANDDDDSPEHDVGVDLSQEWLVHLSGIDLKRSKEREREFFQSQQQEPQVDTRAWLQKMKNAQLEASEGKHDQGRTWSSSSASAGTSLLPSARDEAPAETPVEDLDMKKVDEIAQRVRAVFDNYDGTSPGRDAVIDRGVSRTSSDGAGARSVSSTERSPRDTVQDPSEILTRVHSLFAPQEAPELTLEQQQQLRIQKKVEEVMRNSTPREDSPRPPSVRSTGTVVDAAAVMDRVSSVMRGETTPTGTPRPVPEKPVMSLEDQQMARIMATVEKVMKQSTAREDSREPSPRTPRPERQDSGAGSRASSVDIQDRVGAVMRGEPTSSREVSPRNDPYNWQPNRSSGTAAAVPKIPAHQAAERDRQVQGFAQMSLEDQQMAKIMATVERVMKNSTPREDERVLSERLSQQISGEATVDVGAVMSRVDAAMQNAFSPREEQFSPRTPRDESPRGARGGGGAASASAKRPAQQGRGQYDPDRYAAGEDVGTLDRLMNSPRTPRGPWVDPISGREDSPRTPRGREGRESKTLRWEDSLRS